MKMKKDMVGDKTVMRFDLSNTKRSENFRNFYINNTRFGYTKWDIQMLCSQVSVTMDASGSPIEEIALITMSPSHAKAVLKALESNIKIYEEEYGEIVLPPEEEKAAPLASAAKKNPSR